MKQHQLTTSRSLPGDEVHAWRHAPLPALVRDFARARAYWQQTGEAVLFDAGFPWSLKARRRGEVGRPLSLECFGGLHLY